MHRPALIGGRYAAPRSPALPMQWLASGVDSCYGGPWPGGHGDSECMMEQIIEDLKEKYLKSQDSYPLHPAYYDALVDVEREFSRYKVQLEITDKEDIHG